MRKFESIYKMIFLTQEFVPAHNMTFCNGYRAFYVAEKAWNELASGGVEDESGGWC